jgi:hypothetical protein
VLEPLEPDDVVPDPAGGVTSGLEPGAVLPAPVSAPGAAGLVDGCDIAPPDVSLFAGGAVSSFFEQPSAENMDSAMTAGSNARIGVSFVTFGMAEGMLPQSFLP